MKNTASSSALPCRPRSDSRVTKTPRSELILLEVEADDCPQVLLRVLGLVSRDGSIPATIKASRAANGVAIAIEMDRVSSAASERIAMKVAEIPTVREVRLAGKRVA